MAQRGKPDDALRMLENVVVEGKLQRKDWPSIYNTALDICGHLGRFSRAWKIFNDMKKRSVVPSERARVSVMNAMAESLHKGQEQSTDVSEYWQNAIKIAGDEPYSVFILNALIKIASRLESVEMLNQIFPVSNIPQNADAISFTTVLNLFARQGMYDDCLALITTMIERDMKLTEREYTALLLAIKFQVSRQKGAWTSEFRALQSTRVWDIFSGGAEVMKIAMCSLALEIFSKIKDWDSAAKFVNENIRPKIIECTDLQAIRIEIDAFIIAMSLTTLANSNSPKQAFSLYEICLSKGLRPETGHIEALLLASKAMKSPKTAVSVYESAFKKKRFALKPTPRAERLFRESFSDSGQVMPEEYLKWFDPKLS